MVTPRNPVTSEWVGFHPKALISRSAEEVLRYNFILPPVLLAALFNRLFGIPRIGYFGDPGSLIPYELSMGAVDTYVGFCATICIRLKTRKTEVGWGIAFPGLRGAFPRPANKMALLIELHPKKAETWIAMTNRIIVTWHIARQELESLIG